MEEDLSEEMMKLAQSTKVWVEGVEGRPMLRLVSGEKTVIARLPSTIFRGLTLPRTNIAPENGPSQKESSLPSIRVHALC